MLGHLLLACFVLILAALCMLVPLALSLNPWTAAFVATAVAVVLSLENLELHKELARQEQELARRQVEARKLRRVTYTPFLPVIMELHEEVGALRKAVADRDRADAARRLRHRFCSLCDPAR